jgi:cyclic pyranopterin phosphate synthase
MVDVGDKPITKRRAVAEGWIQLSESSFAAVSAPDNPKGDTLKTAQIAGIQAAKRTSDLIPLCHPIPLTSVTVELEANRESQRVYCSATVCAEWKTGVEMEALTATTAALLTVYDMLKAVDRGMVIGPVQLLEKLGGRSGHWRRSERGAVS